MKLKALCMLSCLAVLAGYDTDASVAPHNGITGDYMLSLGGRCSLTVDSAGLQLDVTSRTAENALKKHFLGLSDNVTYFVEQLDSADVSTHHYRVIFKPQTILSDWDVRGSTDALKTLTQYPTYQGARNAPHST